MSFHQLTDEAWKYVLQFLTPTLPLPRTGVTQEEMLVAESQPVDQLPHDGDPGTTARSDIKAGALAALMSTSIAFNQLAARPLYRRIITDDVVGLLYNYDKPAAHPRVASKRDLLKHARSLQLEYSRKGIEPTYSQLFGEPRGFFVVGSVTKLGAAVVQAAIEADQLHSAFEFLLGSTVFPNLARVAVASVFGAQDGLWEIVRAGHNVVHDFVPRRDDVTGQIKTSAMFFEANLELVPLTHYCQRGHLGPLSLPPFITWSGELIPPSITSSGGFSRLTPLPRPDFCMHFDTHNKVIPVALGSKTRWVLEQHDRVKAIPNLFETISRAMDYSLEARSKVGNARKKYLDLDAYCSSNRYGLDGSSVPISQRERKRAPKFDLQPEGERAICQNMQGSMFKVWQESGTTDKDDVLSWKASVDSPDCWTCGFSFRQDEPRGNEARANETEKQRAHRLKWEKWEDMEYK